MDIFIGSAVCFIARNKYSRLCGLYRFPVIDSYHESQSESCRTKHESDNSHLEQSENKDEKNLSQNTPIVDWASIVQGILSAKPFIPAPYSVIDYHGQLQTSIQFFLRNSYLNAVWLTSLFGLRPPLILYHRELVTLSDGATVGLDWATLPDKDFHHKFSYIHESMDTNYHGRSPINGVVLVCHGLAGNSNSEYVVFQVRKLLLEGYEVVVLNARGCGGVPLSTSQSFAGDRAKDIEEIVNNITHRMRHAKIKNPLFLLGFSLGAATSLKYLGNTGSLSPITAAACISPPWNLEVVTDVFFLWSHLLAAALKGYIVYNYHSLHHVSKTNVTLQQVLSCRTLEDLDDLLVHSYGYETTEEYRRAVSPAHQAQNIAVPTLVISAEDDPVCAVNGIPHPNKRGCGLVIVKTALGGHLAFPSGVFPFTTSWTERIVVDWFNKHI